MSASSAGFVAIGRNEGARLIACLKSLRASGGGDIVYVDSGSTDQSVAAATELGAKIIALDMSIPFTAARARNAGARRLIDEESPRYIQFVDGDCMLADGWLETARAFLDDHPEVAVACGRRRERYPEKTLFNRLCDLEWDTPVGEAQACGGDALIRVEALVEAGLYNDGLVAGEEPELCVRLRERGWKIWRLGAEMTVHDAAMTKFSQWWTRAKRAGHAYAEVSALHQGSPQQIWARETRRALMWSAIAPVSILSALAFGPAFLALLAAYPAQMLRLYLSGRNRLGELAASWAALTVLGKFAEAAGVLQFYGGRILGRKSGLFEYK
ncbi:MAG: glycosyltransferase [Pseudomonadota bacterium]